MTNLDQTLLKRACRYGSFEDVAKRTSLIFHHMVYGAPQFLNKKDMAIYYEALHMIALKVARLVNGTIHDADSWFDIAGYAMLVHNQIAAEQEAKQTKPAESIFNDKTVIDAMEAEITEDIEKAQA